MKDSWDSVRDLRRRASAMREDANRIERAGKEGWSLTVAKIERDAKSIDLDADHMASRIVGLGDAMSFDRRIIVDDGADIADWFRNYKLLVTKATQSGVTPSAFADRAMNAEGHPAWGSDWGPWLTANARAIADLAEETVPRALKQKSGSDTSRLANAMLAVVGAARASQEGVSETVAGLSEAQQSARAAGATESEIDAAIVRGQQDAAEDEEDPYGLSLGVLHLTADSGEPPIHPIRGQQATICPNPLLRQKAEASRLRDASLKAASHAGEACTIGQAPASGRAERARRRTATLDLKDHWNRAIGAKDTAAALAELAHAALAAREAHDSDEYEQRAIKMVEAGTRASVDQGAIAAEYLRKYVAIDPNTGRHLRAATEDEAAAYLAQPAKAPFRKPVIVGEVLVDEDHGYGSSPFGV